MYCLILIDDIWAIAIASPTGTHLRIPCRPVDKTKPPHLINCMYIPDLGRARVFIARSPNAPVPAGDLKAEERLAGGVDKSRVEARHVRWRSVGR